MTKDGYDRIGPFHPYVVWGALTFLNLLIVVALLLALTKVGDEVEDVIAPGGEEWVTF